MFLITEVHPFLDGNGRVARLFMNCELVSANQPRIIIPTPPAMRGHRRPCTETTTSARSRVSRAATTQTRCPESSASLKGGSQLASGRPDPTPTVIWKRHAPTTHQPQNNKARRDSTFPTLPISPMPPMPPTPWPSGAGWTRRSAEQSQHNTGLGVGITQVGGEDDVG